MWGQDDEDDKLPQFLELTLADWTSAFTPDCNSGHKFDFSADSKSEGLQAIRRNQRKDVVSPPPSLLWNDWTMDSKEEEAKVPNAPGVEKNSVKKRWTFPSPNLVTLTEGSPLSTSNTGPGPVLKTTKSSCPTTASRSSSKTKTFLEISGEMGLLWDDWTIDSKEEEAKMPNAPVVEKNLVKKRWTFPSPNPVTLTEGSPLSTSNTDPGPVLKQKAGRTTKISRPSTASRSSSKTEVLSQFSGETGLLWNDWTIDSNEEGSKVPNAPVVKKNSVKKRCTTFPSHNPVTLTEGSPSSTSNMDPGPVLKQKAGLKTKKPRPSRRLPKPKTKTVSQIVGEMGLIWNGWPMDSKEEEAKVPNAPAVEKNSVKKRWTKFPSPNPVTLTEGSPSPLSTSNTDLGPVLKQNVGLTTNCCRPSTASRRSSKTKSVSQSSGETDSTVSPKIVTWRTGCRVVWYIF
jgi:hypothetical protein